MLGIKYGAIPLVMVPLRLLLGLHRTMDVVPPKVLTILSFVPSAFIVPVPPAIYDFDLDLANSGWIATTLALLFLFQVLYVVLVLSASIAASETRSSVPLGGQSSTIFVCRTTWGSENWSVVSVTREDMLQTTAPVEPA